MLTINSVTVKSPQKLRVEVEDRQTVGNNAAGNAVIDRVATKRILEIEWGALTNTEISTIMTALQAVFFSVTYPDPQTGAAKTITCYTRKRTAPMVKNVGGVAVWDGLRVDLIEQ